MLYGDEYTFGYDEERGVFWVIKAGHIGSLLTAVPLLQSPARPSRTAAKSPSDANPA